MLREKIHHEQSLPNTFSHKFTGMKITDLPAAVGFTQILFPFSYIIANNKSV